MSHHLDTPLAAQTGQLYLDDLYVFGGPGKHPGRAAIRSRRRYPKHADRPGSPDRRDGAAAALTPRRA